MDLEIDKAELADGRLLITGFGFGVAKTPRVVVKGVDLRVLSYSATSIVAALPVSLDPGSYSIKVVTFAEGGGEPDWSNISVTVGTLGTQGAAGPPGPGPFPLSCPAGHAAVSTGPGSWACVLLCQGVLQDCDRDGTTCETNVLSDPDNCGACGVSCASGVCSMGSCAAPSCTDGLLNGSETDVDCGGSCPLTCDNGQGCEAGTDCASGICTNGTCAAPASEE
jgi:hypothetical protein